MGRFSPGVLPIATESPWAAGINGVRQGFDIGTGIAERQRQRRRDERSDTRQDEYLDIQKGYKTIAERNAAITRAQQGFRTDGTMPEDGIAVEGGGFLDFGNSQWARERAMDHDYDMRKVYETGDYQDARDATTADLLRQGKIFDVAARAPGALSAIRQPPVVGSPEWKAAERFRTDEMIRGANATGRYNRVGRGGTRTDPTAREMQSIADDLRSEVQMRQREVSRLAPSETTMSPADTAGFGEAQRGLADANRRLGQVMDSRQRALFGPEAPTTRQTQQPGQNFVMDETRTAADQKIREIMASKAPEDVKQRLMKQVMQRYQQSQRGAP